MILLKRTIVDVFGTPQNCRDPSCFKLEFRTSSGNNDPADYRHGDTSPQYATHEVPSVPCLVDTEFRIYLFFVHCSLAKDETRGSVPVGSRERIGPCMG